MFPLSSDKLTRVLNAIDEVNSQDPNTVPFNNNNQAKELIYGHHMTECLTQYWPDASELLQIAVRGQHIKRWHLKRNEFDEGKTGYFKWRKALGKFHAQLTASIMLEQGYSEEQAKQTAAIIGKEQIKTHADTQTLEDVACLVFLQYYFDDFAAKYTGNEAKIIRIVQLTWKKMSKRGHEIALSLTLPDHLAKLVTKALS